MRCHLILMSAVSPIFCSPSWTLFSPKSICPPGPGGPDRLGGEGLGNGTESDGCDVPAGAAGGRVDPGPDRLEVLNDGGVHDGRRSYLMYAFSISALDLAFAAFGPFGASFK